MDRDIKNWVTGQKDIQILSDMATMPIKMVHDKYYPQNNPIVASVLFNNRIQKLKRRIKRYRWYLNNVNNITKTSKYVKKRIIIPEDKGMTLK
jgi:hypothetical protein